MGHPLDPTPEDATDSAMVYPTLPMLGVWPDGRTVVAFGWQSGPPDEIHGYTDPFHLAFRVLGPDGTQLSHVELGTGNSGSMAVSIAPDGDLFLAGTMYGELDLAVAELATPAEPLGSTSPRSTPESWMTRGPKRRRARKSV